MSYLQVTAFKMSYYIAYLGMFFLKLVILFYRNKELNQITFTFQSLCFHCVYTILKNQSIRLLVVSSFSTAYHLLEAAQEREGCVVGESVSQVECMLGPCHHHLAYDILQLVVAESVYHN